MKKEIKLASCAIIAMLFLSCGNKEATSTTEEGTKDSIEVAASKTEAEPVAAVEDISLSLTRAADPCFGNDPDYLNIKGGKPFDDTAKPYKVEAKNTKQASIELGKLTKKDDGSFTMAIPGSMNVADGEATIKIIVTDAVGTEKAIDFVIPYCP